MGNANNKINLLLVVLKPLARLLIQQNVSHNEFSEIAKEAYIEAAKEFFALPKRKITASRISVLTGLSRKEVHRLETSHESKAPIKYQPNRAARVVTGWLRDPEFQDEKGEPHPLPNRGEHSFTALVGKYSGDITAGAILDELLLNGIVEVDDQDRVILLRPGYIPSGSEVEKLGVLLQSTRDLLNAGVYNITRDKSEAPQFQRQLTHLNVPVDIAEEFDALCHEKSAQLLLELDSWLTSKKEQYSNPAIISWQRVGLGIYQIKELDHGKDL